MRAQVEHALLVGLLLAVIGLAFGPYLLRGEGEVAPAQHGPVCPAPDPEAGR